MGPGPGPGPNFQNRAGSEHRAYRGNSDPAGPRPISPNEIQTRFRLPLRYCCAIPESFTTFAQRLVSARMYAANSSGLVGAASTTRSFIRCCTSGDSSTLLTSACTFSMIRRGVPAGAHTPYQDVTSKPVMPDSASVGTDGHAD